MRPLQPPMRKRRLKGSRLNKALIFAAAGALLALWWWQRKDEPGGWEPGREIINGAVEIAGSVGVDMSNLWQPPKAAEKYMAAIRSAEGKYGLPENLLARLLWQESRFREDIITGKTKSPVGALGIAQFMPATAREFKIDPLNPSQAIDAAGRYLAQLFKRFGNWREALAAYNWGQGNVSRKGLDKAPVETRNYFSQILADLGIV